MYSSDYIINKTTNKNLYTVYKNICLTRVKVVVLLASTVFVYFPAKKQENTTHIVLINYM